MTPIWSRIRDGLRPHRDPRGDAAEEAPAPWTRRQREGDAAPSSTLAGLLDEIETAARAVYVAHGLPDQPGHYARSQKSPQWRFVSDALTAEERWALVMAQKPGSHWRFGALEDLGDQTDSPPDLQRAGRMLRTCRQLRLRLAEGPHDLGEAFEAAVRLGMDWTSLATDPPAAPALALPRTDPAPAPADDFLIPPSDGALTSPRSEPVQTPKPARKRRPRAKSASTPTPGGKTGRSRKPRTSPSSKP